MKFRHPPAWCFGPLLACLGSAATLAATLDESSARRMLDQASFGPTEASVTELMHLGKGPWLQTQFALPASDFHGFSYRDPSPKVGCPAGTPTTCNRDNYTVFPLQVQFFQNALTGPDQLRQRVALALSEILVTSGQQIRQPYAMANYQRIFLKNAFGNFRTVLHDVTLSPAMGAFLNMANNDKANPARGTEPNENYAREVLQLFSVGEWQLNVDGSVKTDNQGAPVPTYNQDVIEGFAHAFTGWTYAPRAGAVGKFPNPLNFGGAMQPYAAHHDMGSKLLFNGKVLPAGQSPEVDLDDAIDNIFLHPNVGPFISRQLIKQLVTSNPSPSYIARVSAAFNGINGTPRGDLKAVVSAILLDPEASAPLAPAQFGKLREPIQQLTYLFRALGGQSDGVWLTQQAAALGQPVYSPATVFSFFSPDYALPDDPALSGPSFGIYNASTAFVLSGSFATALSANGAAPDNNVDASTGSKINLGAWQIAAAEPQGLVNRINRVMFASHMTSTLQQTLLKAALSLPASKPLDRARATLFLAVMAPEYLVEH